MEAILASYPTSIWTPPTRGTNMSDAVTQTNILDAQNAEIVAMQTEGGTNPSGSDATIAARFTRIDTATGWASYTPALSGTGWAIGGAGSAALGAWCVTNSIVHFWVHLVTGTGATFGAATVPQISLPAAAETAMYVYSGRGSVVGQIIDASAAIQYKCVGEISGGIVSLTVAGSAAAYATYAYAVGASVPMAWAAGDYVTLNGWYRKA